MKKIICFGDTITEMGTVVELRGYVAQLADRYVRRADVLARGFSGYTTRDARRVLEAAVLSEKPDAVVLQFGGEDCVLPEQVQYVPLEEFADNLASMASDIACTGAWLVMVSPPPVNERLTHSRTLQNSARYLEACRAVADEMNVPIIDLFNGVQAIPDWEDTVMLNGIHLAAAGMDYLYEEVAKALDRLMPFSELEYLGLENT